MAFSLSFLPNLWERHWWEGARLCNLLDARFTRMTIKVHSRQIFMASGNGLFFFYEPFVKLLVNYRAKKLEGFHLFLQATVLYIHIYVMGIDNKKIWKRIEEGYLLFCNECGVFDNIVKMLALELIDWKTDWICAGKWTRFGMFLGHSTNVDETSSHRKAVFQILNGDIPFSLKVLFVWSCFIFLTTKSWKFC